MVFLIGLPNDKYVKHFYFLIFLPCLNTVLYCYVLCCVLLHCIALRCIVLYCSMIRLFLWCLIVQLKSACLYGQILSSKICSLVHKERQILWNVDNCFSSLNTGGLHKRKYYVTSLLCKQNKVKLYLTIFHWHKKLHACSFFSNIQACNYSVHEQYSALSFVSRFSHLGSKSSSSEKDDWLRSTICITVVGCDWCLSILHCSGEKSFPQRSADLLWCFVIVDIHNSGISIPLFLLVLLGWSLM